MDGDEQKIKIIKEAFNAIRDQGVDKGVTVENFEAKSLFLSACNCQSQERAVAILEEINAKFDNKPPWWKNRGAFTAMGAALMGIIYAIADRIR